MSKAPSPGFQPTHVVPRRGMPAWESPDPARPTVPLDPLLPVELVERRGDWGYVRCSNGWGPCWPAPNRPWPTTGPRSRNWRPVPWTARTSRTAPGT